MENWHQRKAVMACLLAGCFTLPNAGAEESTTLEDLGLVPEVERREVRLSDIDTENFEIGMSYGILSVEDFESNPVAVLSLAYHVTEDFFVQARLGQSELGTSSFDRLSGAATLLPATDNTLKFYDLSVGVNAFPGEAFLLNRWALNSNFYFLAGIGATQFAGDDHFTVNAGMGYQLLANDFLSFNFQVRDHLFDTEITGASKTTHNLEFSAGMSFFF